MYMMGPNKLNKQSGFIVELQEIIAELKEKNEKLIIENGLLRESSEEQRNLNRLLRLELKEVESTKESWLIN